MCLKNKRMIRRIACAALAAVAVYAGISAVATLHKALTQPHLLAGTVRHDFLGYYMRAGIAGAICLLSAGIGIFLLTLPLGEGVSLTRDGKERKLCSKSENSPSCR